MKVVIFCGGLGTRLREHSDTIPKPLVHVGPRPILWHLMRYYAHYGHKDFILCLGYRGHMIREYFLNYREWESNDFTLSDGGRRLDLHSKDIDDWRITFVDTGMHSNIGQRLLSVRRFVEAEDVFLANYADGLSDLPLDCHIDRILHTEAVAGFAAVRPVSSLHTISVGPNRKVTCIQSMSQSGMRINGGFFVMRSSIFDYMEPGEDLVESPFQRLIEIDGLAANEYDGFWHAMDTFKDKMALDAMYDEQERPWEVWTSAPAQA